jgi:putative hydrolase of the HAD superfamily
MGQPSSGAAERTDRGLKIRKGAGHNNRTRPLEPADSHRPPAAAEIDRNLWQSRRVDDADSGDIRTPRALLFDLGGVVLDVNFNRVLDAWATRASCDPQALRQRFKFDDAYEQHERGEIDASGYFASLRRSLGLRLSDEDFMAGWSDLYVGLVPGMVSVLAAASEHFPLYAFTNSNPAHQSVWAKRFAPELSVFRSIFVSSELGLRKPDPNAFSKVARRAGFPTSAFIFFDDTLENVIGARTAGMQALHVRSTDDVRVALRELTPLRNRERRTT